MELKMVDLRTEKLCLESNITSVKPVSTGGIALYLTRGYSLVLDKSIIDWINKVYKEKLEIDGIK